MNENTTCFPFLPAWREHAVYNVDDVDDGTVIAQGQSSGRFYVLTLDDDGTVTGAEIYC